MSTLGRMEAKVIAKHRRSRALALVETFLDKAMANSCVGDIDPQLAKA